MKKVVVRHWSGTYNKQHKALMVKKILHQGFALPSIMIASVVMLALLATAISSVTTTRTALDNQYFNQLAKEAAESGLKKAEACIKSYDYRMEWHDGGRTLDLRTRCDGTQDPSMANAYLYSNDRYRSTFEIVETEVDVADYSITSRGTVELLRASSGQVWRTYTYERKVKFNYVAAFSTRISSGYQQVCGITDGTARCWGSNAYGKLGDGTTTDSSTPTDVVRDTGVLMGKTDTEIAVGYNFACVVSDGGVYCWGLNTDGQLGRGATSAYETRPARVTGALASRTVVEIVAGAGYACALTSDSRLYCWGSNGWGQLGDNTVTRRLQPTEVYQGSGLSGKVISQISAKSNHATTCAIASGIAYCWGYNMSGGIGDGSTSPSGRRYPTQVSGLLSGKTVTDIDVGQGGSGRDHTCAVADATAYCWGSGAEGALGNGLTTDSTVPVAVSTASGVTAGTVAEIAVSDTSACALTSSNRIYCWGSNANGQLGINSMATVYSTTPMQVYSAITGGYGLGARTVTELIGGGWRTCAIASSVPYCWGSNNHYQIGDGTAVDRSRPTPVSYLQDLRRPLYY